MLFEEYRQMPEEEILQRIQAGDQVAIDYLLEKYKNLVRQKARALFLIGGDRDDLIQEGMIGLYKAIRDYNNEKQCNFYYFADLCISRQMYSAIKSSNRQKNIPLNTYISLYTPLNNDENETGDNASLVDVMFPNNTKNPEELLIDRESTIHLEQELKEKLSGFEKQVVTMYMNGMKYTEIARIMNKSPKSIDNALQRIRNKLVKIVEEV